MSTFLQQSALLDTDKSACWKLFTYRYLCKVRQMHLTPDWVFSEYGVATSGDRGYDRELMENYMEVYITAVDMAMFIAKGVSSIVVRRGDSVLIYKLVTEHLTDWIKALENNPHISTGPISELREFDALASVLWTVARNFITEEVGTAHLMSRLNNFYVNPLGSRNNVKTTIAIENEHRPVTNDLLKLTTRTKRAWER